MSLLQLPPGVYDPDEATTRDNFKEFFDKELQLGVDNGDLEGLDLDPNSTDVLEIRYISPDGDPTALGLIGVNDATGDCSEVSCTGGSCKAMDERGTFCSCPPNRLGNKCEQLIRCPMLPPIDNAMLSCSGDRTAFGSDCTYTCNQGYAVVGAARLRCFADGWTAQVPSCEPVSCPLPPPIPLPNGRLDCPSGGVFGSTCSFVCDYGFQISSEGGSVSCSVGGFWVGDPPPACHQIVCPTLPAITNGLPPDCTDGVKAGSICTYRCLPGYELMPSPVSRICNSDSMTWSGVEPACVQVVCPSLPGITNGGLPSCPNALPDRTVPIGSSCTYTCNSGYEINGGNAVRTCDTTTRRWTGIMPTCSEILCPVLPAIPNGGLPTCTEGTRAGSTCSYTCDPGYLIGSGQSTRTCNSNTQSWTGSQPICVQQSCIPLGAVSNGGLPDCTNGAISGSMCTYTCATNFRIVFGVATLTCNGNEWSAPAPVCVRVSCPNLPLLNNGAFESCTDGLNGGSICPYGCNDGYAPVDDGTIVCGSDGSWSPAMPVCSPVLCPVLLAIPNGGAPTCSNGFLAGSTCTYQCNLGYQLSQGGGSRTCDGLTRTWSEAPPLCEQITCPTLTVPNADVPACTDGVLGGSVCTITCSEGYQLGSGDTTLICDLSTGTWLGTIPACVRDTLPCTVLPSIDNAVLSCTDGGAHGSVCTYSCASGWTLADDHDGTRTCMNAVWSSRSPVCEAVTLRCTSLPPIDYAVLSCTDGSAHGSVCTYSCSDGWMLANGHDGTRTCQNAVWSNQQPFCEVSVSCPAFPAVPNVELRLCTAGSQPGSICFFQCDDGFTAMGRSYLQCGDDGTWSPEAPVCIQDTLPCTPLPSVNNAVLSCTDGSAHGSVCTYSCITGWMLANGNDGSRTCQFGVWSNQLPVCEVTQCTSLPPIDNAVLSCTDGSAHGSVCTYSCSYGWTLANGHDGIRTCQNAVWSSIKKTICEVACGTRPAFIDSRIVNGALSREGDWPWLASLRSTRGNHQCGATLIDSNWILTAGHCIVDSIDTVVLGDLLLNSSTEYHQEFKINASHKFRHPEYDDFSYRNDIALIKLDEPVVYNDFVRPLCLNTLMEEETSFSEAQCFVAGWGFTTEAGPSASNELYEAQLPFYDLDVCKSQYFIVGIASTQFCAGHSSQDSPDACQGDSGGPYMCLQPGSDTWFNVGVVSYGRDCAKGNPGVYTRISQYMDWIANTMANTL